MTRTSGLALCDSTRETQLTSSIEAWFDENQRSLPWRSTYEPYQVWISEVMLQQTRMDVVLPYFVRFIEHFPNIRALAAADEDEVLAVWSGLGYYRRARMLHAAARFLVDSRNGTLPVEVDDLRTIPGIGRYTAGAISSIAFNAREPIVDGNVTRLLARIDGFECAIGTSRLDRQLWSMAERLVTNAASARSFNQGMMELAATICTPRNPSCDRCPVQDLCTAHRAGAETSFPRIRAAKPVRTMTVDLYVVRRSDGSLLLRREQGALMRGMYHLPQRGALFPPSKLSLNAQKPLGKFRHTVTDRRITFVVFSAELAGTVAESADEFVWIDPASLATVPHPSYVRKALRLDV